MKTLEALVYFLIIFIIFDIMIVLATMAQIGNGKETPHISFWDYQIKAITSVLK